MDDYRSSYQSMDEYELYELGFPLHGRYRFERFLQTGSFGKVSLAFDTITQTPFAIKTMFKQQTLMYRHEISIMNRLQAHPNIVRLVEHFDTRNYHVLVLEYCDGGDLYDKIEQGIPHNTSALFINRLIKQLLDLTKFMHSSKVYHRDLKPENILLTTGGDIKVCDFGLSTILRYPLEINVGTEKYMAPETLTESYYDAISADYWSLGITICFLLFGKCPFRKASIDDDNFRGFINNAEWLTLYYPEMSSTLHDAIKYLLAPSPAARDIEKFETIFFQKANDSVTDAKFTNEFNLMFSLDDEEDQIVDDVDLDFDFEQDTPSKNSTHLSALPIPSSTVPNSFAVPSLMESYSGAFSWADDDLMDENIFKQNLQMINDARFEK